MLAGPIATRTLSYSTLAEAVVACPADLGHEPSDEPLRG